MYVNFTYTIFLQGISDPHIQDSGHPYQQSVQQKWPHPHICICPGQHSEVTDCEDSKLLLFLCSVEIVFLFSFPPLPTSNLKHYTCVLGGFVNLYYA